MPLFPIARQLSCYTPTAAYLEGIPNFMEGGRFPNQAKIRDVSALSQNRKDTLGAMECVFFLISCDQKADGSR
jgi:hypothetical protein